MMMGNLLFYSHAIFLLLFGILLSGAFAGIRPTNVKDNLRFLVMYAICALLQILLYVSGGEDSVRKFYPLSTHLPMILFFCIAYHKRFATALTSVLTAYLFCQPANWFGILVYGLTKNKSLEYATRICILITLAVITIRFLAPYFARIYNKDTRGIYLFGMMPVGYYVFDYIIMVYTKLWINNRTVVEFMPFFFAITYVIFSTIYCRENDEKLHAQHKAELMQITAAQQDREIASIKRVEKEVRILHHDMRHFLNSLSACIEQNDLEHAKEMLASTSSRIEKASIQHFCNIDIFNYILSDFTAKCSANEITFTYKVELESVSIDANLFASILLNVLDNAYNAQLQLPNSSRKVNLTLKTVCGKLLLSVENPVSQEPIFENGIPLSAQAGHGYGTQSICYLTERLNGKYQFQIQKHTFITKIIV